jgi:predicted MFS family arabinose efflux permease
VSTTSPTAAPTEASPTFRAWLVVVLLAIVGALNYLDRVMLTTMRTSLVEAIPMTDAQFGLLTSVFLWVYAVISPFGGFLSDRTSRAKVVLGSLFLWSGVTWMTAHATTFNELLLTRILMGASEACYLPAALALIADYHRGPTRSLATGIHMIGISVGQGLGGLGGVLAERHDWTYAFRLFGIIGVVYSVLLITTLRDRPTTPEEREQNAKFRVRFGEAVVSLFSSRSYWIALAFWGLAAVGGWAVLGWLPTLLGEKFHLSQGTAGMSATGYLQPATWVGLVVGGIWSDYASRRNPRGRLLVTICGLGIAAPAIFLGVNATTFGMAMAGFMIWSFGVAFVNSNMMPILCLIAHERYRATGYGILNLCSCLIGGVTIYLGGALRDAKIPVERIFDASVYIILICCVLLYLIKPAQTPAGPKP